MKNEELIKEARRLEGDFSDLNKVVSAMSALADALEVATTEWEYQCVSEVNTIPIDSDPAKHSERCSGKIHRRRKAGEWVPVEDAIRGGGDSE